MTALCAAYAIRFFYRTHHLSASAWISLCGLHPSKSSPTSEMMTMNNIRWFVSLVIAISVVISIFIPGRRSRSPTLGASDERRRLPSSSFRDFRPADKSLAKRRSQVANRKTNQIFIKHFEWANSILTPVSTIGSEHRCPRQEAVISCEAINKKSKSKLSINWSELIRLFDNRTENQLLSKVRIRKKALSWQADNRCVRACNNDLKLESKTN